MARTLFSSESVTEGHPDKLCDQVSDAILDDILAKDPAARVACECCATTGMVVVFGEITTDCYVDIPAVARGVIRDIGYTDAKMGFDAETCAVLTAIDAQSPDIAQGVDKSSDSRGQAETGAGDQGMMFGCACDETSELMPMPIVYAHRLTCALAQLRKSGALPYLRPDGKSLVSVAYENGAPAGIDAVVVSTQHDEEVTHEQIVYDITETLIKPTLPAELLGGAQLYINPTGRFVVGGPHGDSGLTGRKIIVDTYGGYGRHGGGCFSGKDPTKVDRSGAYAARYAAKNIVAAGLARRCEIELAYAIGVAKPVSVLIDTFGTGKTDDALLAKRVAEVFDFRPGAIIEYFGLRRPIYRQTAAYGHFGRADLALPWEGLELAAKF